MIMALGRELGGGREGGRRGGLRERERRREIRERVFIEKEGKECTVMKLYVLLRWV